ASAGGNIEQQLNEGARRLKELAEERPGGAKTDPELTRLAGLADKAQSEGAIEVALEFRAAASQRADELAANLDVQQAAIDQDRVEISSTYAEHAAAAEINFDF